jgi:hypothetical protein
MMKNINKLNRLILFLMLTLTVNKGFSQNFYEDFVKYQDARTKPQNHVSKSKRHSINRQFAGELRKLFNTVRRNTGFYMLNCDTLYFLSQRTDHFAGGYSELIWNNWHSCYYENPYFSPIYEYRKEPIKIEIDAPEKLLALGPILKSIIQNTDTVGYQKYVKSPEVTLAAGMKFMVAKKIQKHWHFFTSKVFASLPPD